MTTKAHIIEELRKQIEAFEADSSKESVGTVLSVADGVVRLSGLADVKSMELIEFDGGTVGVALNIEESTIGAIILGDSTHIKEGQTAKGTGKILSVPVGEGVVGRVVDPLGKAIDGKGDIGTDADQPIEKIAPGVITRKSVDEPLHTGIKAIDALIPIGRGQRELIIGDRQTGKTAIAIDTIINQKGENVKCVYVAVGQKESKIANITARLEAAGAMEYTTVVLAGASDPASLSYIAPYTGCAIAEYFMDKGEDVLVIYDDLSKHAWAYREISLLLRRPPGREAYPGDVFYLHSRLLERSAKLNEDFGGGSITALPIIETQAGDVSAYIPTNVISITDGQIYLESDLFYKGQRPALNVGLSVSRVGSAAQTKAMKSVAKTLKVDLAQYRELEAFAQFATDLDEATKKQLDRGKRAMELMKQDQYMPIPFEKQSIMILLLNDGLLDDVDADRIQEFESAFMVHLETSASGITSTIAKEKAVSDEMKDKIVKLTEEFKKTF